MSDAAHKDGRTRPHLMTFRATERLDRTYDVFCKRILGVSKGEALQILIESYIEHKFGSREKFLEHMMKGYDEFLTQLEECKQETNGDASGRSPVPVAG